MDGTVNDREYETPHESAGVLVYAYAQMNHQKKGVLLMKTNRSSKKKNARSFEKLLRGSQKRILRALKDVEEMMSRTEGYRARFRTVRS